MSEIGLTVNGKSGSKRLSFRCEHQSGILYVVPSEATWVCEEDLLHVHALAGFFKRLVQLGDPHVMDTMQRYGLYFRDNPATTDSVKGQTPSD